MNWNTIEGNWKQVKGRLKKQWGRLTDDQLDVIAGKRDQLLGALQKTYGVAQEEAERQIQQWEKRFEQEFDEAANAWKYQQPRRVSR